MSGRAIHMLPGPPGAPGSGDGSPPAPATPTTYVFTVPVPDTTWTITHSLGTKTPMVALYDLDGYSIGDADVYAPNTTTVIVSFALPVAGRVVLQA